ncbi:MAG TPA: TolC family protein [Oscillatoriaceae cyanobacterium]
MRLARPLALTLALTTATASTVATAATPALARASRAGGIGARLELAPLLVEAKSHAPGLAEARAEWEAALARAKGEGQLPDPMLQARLMSITRLMGPQVAVSQSIPLGGKLDLRRRIAERQADVARFAYLDAVNRVLGHVKTAYFDLYDAQRAEATAERARLVASRAVKIATTRYAVGTGTQAEPARANVQLAEIIHDTITFHQQRETSAVKLLGLLDRPMIGLGDDAALGRVPDLSTRPFTRPIESVIAEADAHNPAIAQARAELDVARLEAELAGKEAVPDLDTQLGVGQVYMDRGWETALSGMVSINLPIGPARQRDEAAVAAASDTVKAREANLADRTLEVHTRLYEMMHHLVHLNAQVKLYDRGVLPQARQALASEMANFEVDRGSFDALSSAEADLYHDERDEAMAIADYHKMLAELETLTGQEVSSEAP